MQTANWFRTHSRQISVHAAVILVFVLFVVLGSEPLFDRLERFSGEAQLHRLGLPPETGGVIYNAEKVAVAKGAELVVRGWAFIEGYDMYPDDATTYIVLKSDSRTYIFDTGSEARPDVAAHFEELGLNLYWAGFVTNIPLRLVAGGEYAIGIYIRTGDVEALQYTLHTVEV